MKTMFALVIGCALSANALTFNMDQVGEWTADNNILVKNDMPLTTFVDSIWFRVDTAWPMWANDTVPLGQVGFICQAITARWILSVNNQNFAYRVLQIPPGDGYELRNITIDYTVTAKRSAAFQVNDSLKCWMYMRDRANNSRDSILILGKQVIESPVTGLVAGKAPGYLPGNHSRASFDILGRFSPTARIRIEKGQKIILLGSAQ